MKLYRDPVTGYEIRQYTFGPERNAKLYFTTENFSVDDRYFFFEKMRVDTARDQDVLPGLYRAEVETGEIVRLTDEHYSRFAMHWNENYGVICRDDGMIMRIDIETGEMTELGRLPRNSVAQGHLTIANDGRIATTVQLECKLYAVTILDPGKQDAEILYTTDQWLGHCQICPTDSNLIFYVHETGGDALQRTWMFDVAYRMKRPYYVEHPNEWITHETWTADGSHMVFMWIPGKIIVGDKDGRHFDVVFEHEERILHPGVTRDMQWLCTDRYWKDENGAEHFGPMLVNPRTGKGLLLAAPYNCLTGMDHVHPSFNRRGDRILFGAPDEHGISQVCVIDLNQLERP